MHQQNQYGQFNQDHSMQQQQQSQQQQQQQQTVQNLLPEKDWLYTVLCDLKRTVREYATAVTEASDDSLRKIFTDLLNSTLTMQGQVYTLMKQNNMYNASSPAQGQEIQKQIQTYQKSGQEAFQFAKQKLGQHMQQSTGGSQQQIYM